MTEIIKILKEDKWFLLLIAGVVSVPLLTDYIIYGSDLYVTLSQIRVISENIGKSFPVRLETLPTMDYGYEGTAFQANVFYVIPAFLHILGLGLANAYKWTVALFHFMTVLIADICFRKASGKREAGLVGSMLYTWCPYRCSETYLTGDLGQTAAWMFLPLIILGLARLYAENIQKREKETAWMCLWWGVSLTVLSSTVMFSVIVVLLLLFFLVMGKATLKKESLFSIGKALFATGLICAWFLVPMLLRMRNPETLALMQVNNFRGKGIYFLQYVSIFNWAGTGTDFVEDRLVNAQAIGPGIGVVILLMLGCWAIFVGKYQGNDGGAKSQWRIMKGMLVTGLLLMFLSSNVFPWDLMQNRNLLCSIILAMLHTPAKLCAAADLCMISFACFFISVLSERMKQEYEKPLLLTVAVGAWGTTQFLLNYILYTGNFIREEGMADATGLPFTVITQEPLAWRISEAVSLVFLAAFLVWYGVRRWKHAARN